jgi:hypothetical protein
MQPKDDPRVSEVYERLFEATEAIVMELVENGPRYDRALYEEWRETSFEYELRCAECGYKIDDLVEARQKVERLMDALIAMPMPDWPKQGGGR